ncbi:MAG: hypothetical protein ACRD38_03795 [Nitrososphaerales archaeon]
MDTRYGTAFLRYGHGMDKIFLRYGHRYGHRHGHRHGLGRVIGVVIGMVIGMVLAGS